MIYIANPIYDAVFKFMMEDEDVAKRFIGIIINRTITKITLLPQEKTIVKDELPIRIQRLDFVAHITEPDGKLSKVLIELQKSNQYYHADVMRFRGYLAKQYTLDDLPIITIYLLGFVLDEALPASLCAAREYTNLSTQTKINHRNEFIEKLSHDCYVIQIPLLKKPLRTKIDHVLSIFDQNQVISKDIEGKKVLVYDLPTKDDDIQAIVKRLELANANEALREKIQDEEYLEKAYQEAFGKMETEMIELKENLEQERIEKQRAEQEKQRAEQEKQRAEQEKQRAEQEKQQIEQKLVETIKNMFQMGLTVKEIKQMANVDDAFLKKHGLI